MPRGATHLASVLTDLPRTMHSVGFRAASGRFEEKYAWYCSRLPQVSFVEVESSMGHGFRDRHLLLALLLAATGSLRAAAGDPSLPPRLLPLDVAEAPAAMESRGGRPTPLFDERDPAIDTETQDAPQALRARRLPEKPVEVSDRERPARHQARESTGGGWALAEGTLPAFSGRIDFTRLGWLLLCAGGALGGIWLACTRRELASVAARPAAADGSPAIDLLAALIGNRLPLVEEPLELPRVARVHGRLVSSASWRSDEAGLVALTQNPGDIPGLKLDEEPQIPSSAPPRIDARAPHFLDAATARRQAAWVEKGGRL